MHGQTQRTPVNILGLSGLSHDSAAALLSDSGILAAMEESKLVRRRTGHGNSARGDPLLLERAGTGWSGVECVAVASRPVRAWVRQAWMRAKRTPFAPVPSGYYQTKALGELGRELNNGRLLETLGESPNLRVLHLEHHLCHAASAFYASPFDRAMVLTLDERAMATPAASRWVRTPSCARWNRLRSLTLPDGFFPGHRPDGFYAACGRAQDAMAGPRR